MVSMWIILGLILATFSVSILGATFSVVGLGALFSGAVLAVWAMAASLEFAKFILSAYLHQRWNELNKVFRGYLVFAVFVLSLITSMGIFGFLSDAYQSAQNALDGETIKLEAFQSQQQKNTNEIARLTQSVNEIPVTRVSKRIALRAEIEPAIAELNKANDQILANITQSQLRLHEIKKRVGPLIYIARAFKIDLDTTVKYLILIFVSVFDPLAICLVIATSQALESRNKKNAVKTSQTISPSPSVSISPEIKNLSIVNESTSSDIESTTIKMRFSEPEEKDHKEAV